MLIGNSRILISIKPKVKGRIKLPALSLYEKIFLNLLKLIYGIITVARNIPADSPVIARTNDAEFHIPNAFPAPSIIRGRNKIERNNISFIEEGALKYFLDIRRDK